jgi:hypothetical protein
MGNKKVPKKKSLINSVYVWAWKIKAPSGWLLCCWAEPSKEALRTIKPSPEAKAVKVRMGIMTCLKTTISLMGSFYLEGE